MINSCKSCHTSFSGRVSKISTFILVAAAYFMLAGNALSGDLKDVKVSPFKAYYYTESDGKDPGKGNDGTIKNIVSKLQFTESVKRPSIHLSFPFYGIDSYNFYGVWEGMMHVVGEGQSVKANFDVSNADVSFYVNDVLVEKWKNDSKIVPFNLNKGDNQIRVELHNHWHTTSFNVSFTDYQKLDKSAASELFKDIDFNSIKAVYLGAYEASSSTPGDNYNEILVTLPKSPVPIFIFLNSFRAINWEINNPHNAKIVGVTLRGQSSGSTVTMNSSAPIYEFPNEKNAYNNSHHVKAWVGKNADYAFTKYSLRNITVPDFFQARAHEYPKKSNPISHAVSSSSSEAEKYPVNSFIETLVVEDKNNTVTKTQVVKEPTFVGTFIKGNWKGYFDVSTKTDKSFKISQQGIRAELIIDGRSVWQGDNSREKIYQHTFAPGRHEVMFVAYPEESRPVKFNVAITDNAKDLQYYELAAHLKKLGDFDSFYCGVQKSTSPDQPVDVILKETEKPVVLFLTSYQHATWNFNNCNTSKLAAVVTSAKNASGSIKNLPPHIPIYHFFNLANTTNFIPVQGKRLNIKNTFKSAALQILAITGKLPVGFTGAKQAAAIKVPGIVLDREKYQQVGLADVSSDYDIFIEYPQKIDAVFNPVTTKYVDQHSTSEFRRGRQITPEVQRKSWAEPLGATRDIPTGAFKAFYFDIFNPGHPQFSGIVKDVSVSSSGGRKPYDIIPENFGAFWIGNIVLEEDSEMEINIDSGHSITRILIDNKVVKNRRISLKKGLHKIEIEHVNDWHTYNFSFSLIKPSVYSELMGQFGKIFHRINEGTQQRKR